MDHPLDCLGHLLWMLMLVHLPLQEVHGFFPNIWSRTMGFTWGSITHQDMTEDAILNITLRLFSEIPHPTKGNRIQEEDFKVREKWTWIPERNVRWKEQISLQESGTGYSRGGQLIFPRDHIRSFIVEGD